MNLPVNAVDRNYKRVTDSTAPASSSNHGPANRLSAIGLTGGEFQRSGDLTSRFPASRVFVCIDPSDGSDQIIQMRPTEWHGAEHGTEKRPVGRDQEESWRHCLQEAPSTLILLPYAPWVNA
jgi:hypothetical protein